MRGIVISISILIIIGISFVAYNSFRGSGEETVTEEDIKDTIYIEETDKGESQLYNYVDGYQLTLNDSYTLDRSMEEVRTRLQNDTTTIDIFFDQFKGTIDTKDTYMNYSNKFTENEKYHRVIKDEYKKVNGFDVHIVEWTRDQLKHVKDDKNYYASLEIAENKYDVYTIFMKSTKQIEDAEQLLKSFKVIDQVAKPQKAKWEVVERNWSEETKNYYDATFINREQMQWGIFDASFLDNLSKTKELEEKLNYTFPVLLRYQMIGEHDFPKEEMQAAYEEGRTIELTMQYSGTDEVILYEILNGTYDDYLHNYVKGIKEFGHPVLFRLNNEMNGDWVTYSAYHASKDTDLYNEVWKYIYGLFEKYEVDNAIWVWNPNHNSKPNYKWNHTLMYFPGTEYIDIVGLTAYNTGTYYEGEEWTDFKTLYDEIYYEYVEWFDHPMMITEFASSSVGGDKVQWINEMFETIDDYERVKLSVWWSWQDFDGEGNPARIYFLDENEDTVEAFKNGLTKYN